MSKTVTAVIPHLVVDDANAALEFYKKALGAEETARVPAEDGKRLMHAEIRIGDARVYVRDIFQEYCSGGGKDGSPKTFGGTAVSLHLEVENCDAAVDRAAKAGATVVMPPEDAFWGDRFGVVSDPFGHSWSFSHVLVPQPA